MPIAAFSSIKRSRGTRRGLAKISFGTCTAAAFVTSIPFVACCGNGASSVMQGPGSNSIPVEWMTDPLLLFCAESAAEEQPHGRCRILRQNQIWMAMRAPFALVAVAALRESTPCRCLHPVHSIPSASASAGR